MTMRAIAWLFAALVAGAAGVASAAGGADIRLSPAPVNRLDEESLQRGARNFVNYCLSCHTAKYMRYNRLTDLGLSEAQITGNLMFASDKIGCKTAVLVLSPGAELTVERPEAEFNNLALYHIRWDGVELRGQAAEDPERPLSLKKLTYI